MFGSVFRFSHLKTAVLRFSVFGSLVFGFFDNDCGFSDFFVRCVVRFFWFCGFAKEVIPRSRAKTGVIPRSDQRTIYIAFYRLF